MRSSGRFRSYHCSAEIADTPLSASVVKTAKQKRQRGQQRSAKAKAARFERGLQGRVKDRARLAAEEGRALIGAKVQSPSPETSVHDDSGQSEEAAEVARETLAIQ